jgi:phytol kinase
MIFDPTQVDWIIVVVFVPLFYFSFWLPFILKRLKFPGWFTRKSSHILVNVSIALLSFWMTNLFDFIITFFTLLAIVIITSYIPQIKMMTRVYEGNLREEEKSLFFTISTVLCIVTLWTVMFVFHDSKYIIMAAYLALAIGDGAGEMIGKPLGRIKYKVFVEKSLEGTIAVFVGIAISIAISFAVYDIVFISNIWKIFVIALIGTGAEALTYVGLDNSTVPLSVAVSLYLLMLI